MPDSNDTKTIISILENEASKRNARHSDMDDSIKDIDQSLKSIDLNMNGIKSYFIGIDPQKHIIHHVRMEETVAMNNSIKKAVMGAVVSAIFTGLMAFMQWTAISAQKDMQAQISEIIKKQTAPVIVFPEKK